MDSEGNSSTKPDLANAPRENLILTAEKFLRNPKVLQSPLEEKLTFLRKKGLTEDEIKVAVERCSVPSNSSNINPTLQPNMVAVPAPVLHPKRSPLATFRDVGNTVALIGAAAYGMHRLYQWWWSNPETPKNDPLVNVEESLSEVKDSLASIRAVVLQSEDIRKELATLKGLMLSKNQFAPPPISNAGIPAWQANYSKKKEVPAPETKDVSNGHEVEVTSDSPPLPEKKGASKTGKRLLEKEVESDKEAVSVNGEEDLVGHEDKKSAKQSVVVVNGEAMVNGEALVNGDCCERTFGDGQSMTTTSVN